jgi:hypothetical protein
MAGTVPEEDCECWTAVACRGGANAGEYEMLFVRTGVPRRAS